MQVQENNQPTKEEIALSNISSVCRASKMSWDEHIQIQNDLKVIKDFLDNKVSRKEELKEVIETSSKNGLDKK